MKQTTTAEELRAWVEAGMTHKQIAEKLGCHKTNVAVTCSVLGIRAVSRSTKRADKYLSDLAAGLTLAQIAEKHDAYITTVRRSMVRAGLPTCSRAYLQWKAAQGVAA